MKRLLVKRKFGVFMDNEFFNCYNKKQMEKDIEDLEKEGWIRKMP